MGLHRITYQYKEYKGCPQATELSRKWESIKAISWTIWLFVFGGGLLGAWGISQLIKDNFDLAIMFQIMLSLATFSAGFVYVYYSKYVYPRCEELFLLSKKTKENAIAIEQALVQNRERRKNVIKKAIIKFLVIYLLVFCLYVIFFCSE